MPNFRNFLSLVVQCNACKNSLGVVLMQNGRVLSWTHYLLGTNFVSKQIITACDTFSKKPKCLRNTCDVQTFVNDPYTMVHVEGEKNVVADALSQKPQISAVSIPYPYDLDKIKTQNVEA